MSNRILRDWTDSEKIDTLSFQAEVLFIRLFMKADDFGCFHANPKLVKAAIFPLKDVREADVTRWMNECLQSGLIAFYEESGKKYLMIKNFGQRLRTMNRKFPKPDENILDRNPPQVADNPPPETKRNETEVESEGANAQTYTPEEKTSFKNFEAFIHNSAPKVAKMQSPFTIDEYAKLKAEFSTGQIKGLLQKMHNYKPLLSKNVSAYLTFLNWSRNNYEKEEAKVVHFGPSPAEIQAQQIFNEVNKVNGY